MRSTTTAAFVAALALSTSATVRAEPPLAIARQGYLFAGGKYSTVDGRQVMNGQVYVEFQIPQKRTPPGMITIG